MKQKQISESFLSLKEVRILIDSVSDARDKLMIRMLYETGCEVSELVDVKVKDLLGNKIKIKSSNGIRFSQISQKFSKDIRNYINGNNLQKTSFLFSTRQSGRISERRLRQLIQKYSKTIFNKIINPQMFRYLHIAHAYLNGILLETISKQIGISEYRIFQVINDFNIKPVANYNPFLKRI